MKEDPDHADKCKHGVLVDRLECDDGWATPYADACGQCEGKPAGLRYKDRAKLEPGVVFKLKLKPPPPWFGVYAPGNNLLAIFPSRRTAAIYARGPHCAGLEDEPYVYVVYGEASQVPPPGPGEHGFTSK